MAILGIIVGLLAGLVCNYYDHKLGKCEYTMWTCKESWIATLFLVVFCGVAGYWFFR